MNACPHCAAEVRPDDNFCEDCGHGLAAALVLPPEGRQDPRDHLEIVVSAEFAAISDRGLVHHHNEDMAAIVACAAPAGLTQIAVVCDGVSISSNPQEASRAGVVAMVDATVAALLDGAGLEAAAGAGVAAAQAAVCACTAPDDLSGAASTLVAVLRRGSEGMLVWIGDSRAYLLNGSLGRQLTIDDSWVNEAVAAGQMSVEDADNHPNAHAITRCLGPLGEEEAFLPHIQAITLPPAGRLLLCSDGLWNYARTPEDLLAVLVEQPESDAVTACRALVDHAKSEGGRDNITVVLLRL